MIDKKIMQKRNFGFALPMALAVLGVTGFISATIFKRLGYDFSSLMSFRLNSNRNFTINQASEFLQNPHIVRGLIATGEQNALNCWSGLVDNGCIAGQTNQLTLLLPNTTETSGSRLSFSANGSLCDDSTNRCEYETTVTFRAGCPDNAAVCRMAKKGTLNISLRSRSKGDKKTLERSFEYDFLLHPLITAWNTFQAVYPTFYFDPWNQAGSAVVHDNNLINCATARYDGLNCYAGSYWIPAYREGKVLHYAVRPENSDWTYSCPTESDSCPFNGWVHTQISCPGSASRCEYAAKIDFTEYLLTPYDANLHRPQRHIWNFETPVGTNTDTLNVFMRHGMTYYPPNPFLVANITINTYRGEAWFTNCGQIQVMSRGFQHLSCNKDGTSSFSRTIKARWNSCNRLDVNIFSHNSPVQINTTVGSWYGYLRINSIGPYFIQFGMEDSPGGDYDYDDYFFEIAFPAGMRFYIPGFFSNCI